eukprot:1200358-Amphidinium_carterae.1
MDPTPAELGSRKSKVSTLADQGNDLEVEPLTKETVDQAYAHYQTVTGGKPAPYEELTLPQPSCLHGLLQGPGSPYVDFAIWRP